MYYNQDSVLDLFADLTTSSYPWILPWSINGELPSRLVFGKDIDILVKSEHISSLVRHLKLFGYSHVPHPCRDDVFLYGTKPPVRVLSKNNIPLDISSQVTVRSLDAGQWIPLHENLHLSIWRSAFPTLLHSTRCLVPSTEDKLVCIICRAIFNKRFFSLDAQSYIHESLKVAAPDELIEKLGLVFYSFAPHLFALLKSSQFDDVLPSYLSFSGY